MINLVKKQKYQARQKKNAQYNQKKSSKYKTMLLKVELRVEINKKKRCSIANPYMQAEK